MYFGTLVETSFSIVFHCVLWSSSLKQIGVDCCQCFALCQLYQTEEQCTLQKRVFNTISTCDHKASIMIV